MPFLGLLLSRGGLTFVAVAFAAAAIGVQTLRLDHAKADLAASRAAVAAEEASVAASERDRATEHRQAVQAVSDAEKACGARVEEAHRSADRIRTLVEKPHAPDPKTGCPVRALLHVDELRDAIHPPS